MAALTSISSNNSNAALRVLQSTSRDMEQAQLRIATGLKVNQASDDPLAWSIATKLRGTIKSNENYKTGLTDALTQTKVTTNALGQIDKSARAIRSKVDEWSNTTDTAKKTALVNDISNIQKDITDAIASAKYNGVNWLDKTAGSFTIVSGATTSISVTVSDEINGTSAGIFTSNVVKAATASSSADKTLLNFGAGTLADDITNLRDKLDAAITAVGKAQTNFGAAQETIGNRQEYLSSLNDILSNQLGELVNANLEEESAKLSALQIRQQLATTALSIINQSQLNILRLFQ